MYRSDSVEISDAKLEVRKSSFHLAAKIRIAVQLGFERSCDRVDGGPGLHDDAGGSGQTREFGGALARFQSPKCHGFRAFPMAVFAIKNVRAETRRALHIKRHILISIARLF